MSPLVSAATVSRTLGSTLALDDVEISLDAGEVIAVVGPSGCGKSTLLQVLAGLLEPDKGTVTFREIDLFQLNDRARSEIRLRHFGFAFQFGELVPELTLQENVELPLRLSGVSARDARARSAAILSELEISALGVRRATEVSGGQAQRAAIARAMVHEPAVLFADEPTGALDSKSGKSVLGAMLSLARDRGTAVLIVTHDSYVAGQADRIVEMRDGTVLSGSNR
ncbi:MAG: ATP-binding cassette domain-containing protein [Hamadaea sp.]|uniref:ABC transporter ATP-binding protein n=1 Tax=Hamadaea sp. TaxID=2024425 RepID=UPI0017940731|nr:ATP-binding cassette domain-containing protein [Hamadaea sp.]NUR70862.1 ATP-binding cassette domain-containing protein [Hamadaea sp.]NUT20883.1 ATP-binding cassette domain-containing protein [Hamadaea sp.]